MPLPKSEDMAPMLFEDTPPPSRRTSWGNCSQQTKLKTNMKGEKIQKLGYILSSPVATGI